MYITKYVLCHCDLKRYRHFMENKVKIFKVYVYTFVH